MNEQKSGTEEPPAKRMRRTYNHRKWWTCWGIQKYQWQYPSLQEAFIRIYSMKHRAPFSAIPEYIFREILTYVDFLACHRLKMHKEYLLWWKHFWNPDCVCNREGMRRAFMEIYPIKYRLPFSAIPAYIFREILTYSQLEENKEADN